MGRTDLDSLKLTGGVDAAGAMSAASVSGTTISAPADGLRSGGEVAASRIPVSYSQLANGVLADATFFQADRAYTVVSIRGSATTAATAATTLQVTKDTGTQAPGAGVDLLATPFDLTTAANTSLNGALATGAGVLDLATGDRLSLDFSGTAAPLAGVSVTVMLKPKAS